MLKGVRYFLIEQPDSPRFQRGDTFDDSTTVRVFHFNNAYWKLIKDSVKRAIADLGEEDDGYLIDYSMEHKVPYSRIELTYSTLPPDGSLPALQRIINKPQYYLDSSPNNIPLNQLSNYLTKWNYDLASKDGITAIPSWWNTAKTTVIPVADRANYQWLKDSPQAPDGWSIIANATKQGLEEKLNFAAVIREERWCRSMDVAIKYIVRKTSKITPAQTYSYTGEWLAQPSTVAPEGKLFHVTTLYINQTTWDADVYQN